MYNVCIALQYLVQCSYAGQFFKTTRKYSVDFCVETLKILSMIMSSVMSKQS
jgi:hypothetical protein